MLGRTFGTEKGSWWSGEGDFLWTRWLDSKYGLMRDLCAWEKRNCQAWIQGCVTWVTQGTAGLVRQEDCVKAGVFGRKDQKFNLGYSLDIQREVSILDLSRIVNSISPSFYTHHLLFTAPTLVIWIRTLGLSYAKLPLLHSKQDREPCTPPTPISAPAEGKWPPLSHLSTAACCCDPASTAHFLGGRQRDHKTHRVLSGSN